MLDLTDKVFLPHDFNDTHRTSVIHQGDVLLNLVGASIGRSAIATLELAGANLNQAVAIIRLVPHGMLNGLVMYFILSPWLQSYIAKTKADVARANFNLDDVRPTPIPVPPVDEQARIVAELERHLSIIHEAEAQITATLTRSARLRQAILKRAFEGKLVAQHPVDEPTEKLLTGIGGKRSKPKRNAGTCVGAIRKGK